MKRGAISAKVGFYTIGRRGEGVDVDGDQEVLSTRFGRVPFLHAGFCHSELLP